jgi:hypothetical protein
MTAMTPIKVFQEAAERGLKLGIKPPHTLTVQPANRCPRDFADTLSQHKWHLLVLLQLPFCMAYSNVLGETIFFAEDEDTRATLVEAGALPGSVYTRDELSILVEAKRVFNAELKGVAIRATMPVSGVLQDRCHQPEPAFLINDNQPSNMRVQLAADLDKSRLLTTTGGVDIRR